jgi:hypothetical protein
MDRITHQTPRQQGYGSTSSLRNDSLKHTQKHERKERGIEPRSKAARHWRIVRPGGADGPHWPRGQSGQEPRTVRPGASDSPTRSRGQSVKANRTTRDEPGKTDYPQGPGGPSAPDPDRPLLKLGPSTNRLQQKPKTKPDQNKNTKNMRRTGLNWHLADGPRRRGSLSASSNRTGKSRARKVNSTNSSPEIPNGSSS